MNGKELQDFVKKITEIKETNKEDFNKIKYIVDGVLLAQNSKRNPVEKSV